MSAFRCRVERGGDTCGQPAAVGLVTETEPEPVPDGPDVILELTPLCEDHAPEVLAEVATGMDRAEWALVSLAYGTAEGGLT